MIFETLNQGILFLIFLFFGMVLGIFNYLVFLTIKKFNFNTNNVILLNKMLKVKNTKKIKLTKKQKIKTITFNILLCLIILLNFIAFFAISYYFNFGKIRLFEILAFLLGIGLALIVLKNIKAKIIKIKLKKILLTK